MHELSGWNLLAVPLISAERSADVPDDASSTPDGKSRKSGDETARRRRRPGPGLRSGDWIRGRRENATWAGRYSSMGVRARTYRWPPLRLTRLRYERVPVGVVGPQFSRHVGASGEGSEGESDRARRAPRLLRGRDRRSGRGPLGRADRGPAG